MKTIITKTEAALLLIAATCLVLLTVIPQPAASTEAGKRARKITVCPRQDLVPDQPIRCTTIRLR